MSIQDKRYYIVRLPLGDLYTDYCERWTNDIRRARSYKKLGAAINKALRLKRVTYNSRFAIMDSEGCQVDV